MHGQLVECGPLTVGCRTSVCSLFLSNKEVDVDISNSLLGNSNTELIKNSLISLTSNDDKLVWTKNSTGAFFIKSAWDDIRERGLSLFIYKKIWNPQRPLKISIFVRKVLHRAVPVDLLVQKRGIYMASKCCCCPTNPDMESTLHLFLQGEVANEI